MAFQPVNHADAENYYDNRWINDQMGTPGQSAGYNVGPGRNAPEEPAFREWDSQQGVWHQGPKVLPHFKPNHYWTRPHDGRRPGFTGRMMDVLSGKGADVYITTSGDKRTLLRDRPQRWQWAGWNLTSQERFDMQFFDKDFRNQDLDPVRGRESRRAAEPYYNYRTREYASAQKVSRQGLRNPMKVWTNAYWPQDNRFGSQSPWAHRDFFNRWWSRVPFNSGMWAGGRPRQP